MVGGGQSGSDVGIENLIVTVRDLLQARRGSAQDVKKEKDLDGVGGELVSTSSGKMACMELEDVP